MQASNWWKPYYFSICVLIEFLFCLHTISSQYISISRGWEKQNKVSICESLIIWVYLKFSRRCWSIWIKMIFEPVNMVCIVRLTFILSISHYFLKFVSLTICLLKSIWNVFLVICKRSAILFWFQMVRVGQIEH